MASQTSDNAYQGRCRTIVGVLQRLALGIHEAPAKGEGIDDPPPTEREKKLANLLAKTVEGLDLLLLELEREASDVLQPTCK